MAGAAVEAGVRPFKVLILGNSAVGKTTLVDRITTSIFNHETQPTIGAGFSVVSTEVMGSRGSMPVKAHLWDTSGQELYRSITTSYFRGADAAIFCFDLTDDSSRDALLAQWVEDLADQASDALVLLVGCKHDLTVHGDGDARSDGGTSTTARGPAFGSAVSRERAEETARELELTLQARRIEDGVPNAPSATSMPGSRSGGSDRLTDGKDASWSPWRVRYIATSSVSGEGVEPMIRGLL